jgi:O-glycosyl hydrolase
MRTFLLYSLGALVWLLSCKKDQAKPNLAPFIESLSSKILSYDPFEVEFTVKAFDQEFETLTYAWNFGNGQFEPGKNVEKRTFPINQDFTVTVSVKDAKNESRSSLSFSTKIKEVNLVADLNTRHQQMKGFGGFGAQKVWWDNEPFYDAAFVNTLLSDLGVSILRDEIPHSFEPSNDNADPNNINWAGFNTTRDANGDDSHLGQHFPYLKAMREAGLPTLIATIWTPPIWMKYIQHRGNGINDPNAAGAYSAPAYTRNPNSQTNQLKPENYAELAEYCVAYIRLLKERTGIDLYAISLQNEPRFSQFYGSCVHSPESLRDLIKVVGKRFETEGIKTLIFMPEDVQSMFHIRGYMQAVLNDAEARNYAGIFAIHNYANDGINPSNEGPANWRETFQMASSAKREVWMTETSGFKSGFVEGGLELAKSIYNALYYGNASAWVYWQMSDGSDGALIRNGQKTALYYVSKHFYRYIRPGALRFQAETGDNTLPVLAFEHPLDKTISIVAFNLSKNPQQLKLSSNLPAKTYEVYLSDTRTNCEKQNQMAKAGEAYLLPEQSIVTLVGRY